MALPLIAAGISVIGGLISASRAKDASRRARTRRMNAEARLADLEARRQRIEDPYADIQDLSSMVTNPYANLQVATGAAEMQAQEADIALATTLDALRATGASAGGATALAQAAARSKQGIAADIQRQEAENARLRAQGQSEMQRLQMSERIRVQQARARGKEFVFGATEAREMQQLNRQAALAQNAMSAEMAYSAQAGAALGSALGNIGSALMGADFSGGNSSGSSNNSNQGALLDIDGRLVAGNYTNEQADAIRGVQSAISSNPFILG